MALGVYVDDTCIFKWQCGICFKWSVIQETEKEISGKMSMSQEISLHPSNISSYLYINGPWSLRMARYVYLCDKTETVLTEALYNRQRHKWVGNGRIKSTNHYELFIMPVKK